MLGENTMNKLRLKIFNILAAASFIFTLNNISHAQEINLPGFSGNMNTTVTTGTSVRVGQEDCELVAGYNYATSATSTDSNYIGASTAGIILTYSGNSLTDTITTPYGSASLLTIGEKQYGCASRRTDGYGNTSADRIGLTSTSADDGRMNFRDVGDIIDATSQIYTEIIGSTDTGVGVNLSLVGSINPVLDITDPDFKELTAKAENQLDHDFSILNAYITQSFDTPNSYVDVTAGRFVTSFGEATFIPIGMNGLVTNAIDLSKLRAPGASIKESLMPTEQISLNFGLGEGVGLEVYTQFSADQVVIDPRGSYFGSDLMTGSQKIQAAGASDYEFGRGGGCEWLLTAATSGNYYGINGEGLACNATTVAKSAANPNTYHGQALLIEGFKDAVEADWTNAQSEAAASSLGAHLQDTDITTTIASTMATHSDVTKLNAAMQRLSPYALGNTATLNIVASDDKFIEAKDDGQFGLALRGYTDYGNGIDWGVYYSNYHSKVPYVQFVGKQGIFSGDMAGILMHVASDMNSFIGNNGTAFDPTDASNALLTGLTTFMGGDLSGSAGLDSTDATDIILAKALVSNLYGTTCTALGKVGLQGATGLTVGAGAQEGREVYERMVFQTEIDGVLVGNTQSCYNLFDNNATDTALNATTTSQAKLGAFMQSTAILAGAIGPLSEVTYQFVYPEDNEVFGLSANTNVGSTMVQAEVTYRPQFPLATNAWDQVAQIADVSGVTGGLTAFAIHNTVAAYAALTCVSTDNPSGSTSTANGLTFCNAVEDDGIPVVTSPTKATMTTVLGSWVDGINTAYSGAGITLAGTSTSKTFNTAIKETRRSSLTPILQSTAEAGDYTTQSYINKDVWAGTFGTTSSFAASHPIVESLGADSAVLLTEVGVVSVMGYNPSYGGDGFIARGSAGFNEGSGEFLCLGAFQDLSAATAGAISSTLAVDTDFATDAGNGLLGDTFTNMGSSVVDSLFGNGSYCESQNGIDTTSWTYRVVGSANYFNAFNSPWNINPSFVWSHDPKGYGPQSLGGFSEGRMSLSLNTNFTKGDSIKVSLSYVNQLGSTMDNNQTDRDYMSATFSYSF